MQVRIPRNLPKKCLNNNIVPNGLKVFVEPSIGNRDEGFLTLWHSRLDKFSKTSDVVKYWETKIEKTKNKINEIGNRLKDLVIAPGYVEITKTIAINKQKQPTHAKEKPKVLPTKI